MQREEESKVSNEEAKEVHENENKHVAIVEGGNSSEPEIIELFPEVVLPEIDQIMEA